MKNKTLFLSLLFASITLTGCSTLEVASLVTMAVTGKGFGDHALSVVSGQDCNFFNIVQGEKVCYFENSTEMLLLTSNQSIDDSLIATGLDNIPVNSYLVIGSFSDRNNAESYQSEFGHLNSSVITSELTVNTIDPVYRVIVGPVEQHHRDRMKKTLINEGVDSPWLITL